MLHISEGIYDDIITSQLDEVMKIPNKPQILDKYLINMGFSCVQGIGIL